jgi:hypothetical protein
MVEIGEEIASQDASNANFDHPTDSAWAIGAWSTFDQYWLENATLDEMRVLDEALAPGDLGFFGSVTPVEPQEKLSTSWGRIKS